MWLKLTSIYLMHYCHFEGQMFLYPMLQEAQLFSIALQRRGSNERYRLCVTHRLDLYSTPLRAQMLLLNYSSLSPFCSNTSTVHWFYGSTWDCYCNIPEYLSVFLYGKCSSCTAIWRSAIPVHKLSHLFSFRNGVKSPSFERLHRLIFCKILDLQNKEMPRLWLRKLEIFTPLRDKESWPSKVLFFTPSFKWAPTNKAFLGEGKSTLDENPDKIQSSFPHS